MFLKKSLLFILLAAFALLATPALAKDPVTKLVVRNNLKVGRQFEAVFQPGLYVLHPVSTGHRDAGLELHVISNPAPACLIRGDHNHPDHVGHTDPKWLIPGSIWRYFEVQDTCYLRFEITNYNWGAVNIRQVKKVKTIELTADWQEVTFGPGRWSGSGLHRYFTAEYRFDHYSSPCYRYRAGNDDYGITNATEAKFGSNLAFNLDKPCTLEMRGLLRSQDNPRKWVPGPQTVTFVKSR